MTTTSNLHRQTDTSDDHEKKGTQPAAVFELGDLVLRIAHYDEHGVPWFVATDLGVGLCLRNIRKSLQSLEADEKGVATIYTLGGDQVVNIVSESGMYQLICMSKKKAAKAFKAWLFTKVLPSIRKTGSYVQPGVTLPSGLDPAVLALITQFLQGQGVNQTAMTNQLSEIATVQRETLESQRANARLARFPSVTEIPRENVRIKLHEVIDTAAMGRGCCTAHMWRELYLELRRLEIIDLYAKKTALRRRHGRWFSLIQIIERAGLLDITYTTARDYFVNDIRATPRESNVERILMLEEPPTREELRLAQEEKMTAELMAFSRSSNSLN